MHKGLVLVTEIFYKVVYQALLVVDALALCDDCSQNIFSRLQFDNLSDVKAFLRFFVFRPYVGTVPLTEPVPSGP
uniref:Uncharacterized protein n=1 Tax=Ixodes ricinus TaxID=34613 RepID=A0A0K8R6U4_IXORI